MYGVGCEVSGRLSLRVASGAVCLTLLKSGEYLMTNSNNPNQEIYTLLAELARRQLQTETNLQRTQEKINHTQEQIERTQIQVDQTQRQLLATQFEIERLTNNVDNVFSRNEVLNGILLQLRDNQDNLQARFDRHLQNFDENQRTTNAALEQLTAILLRLTRNEN
jgi:chromosome segregation ATPase